MNVNEIRSKDQNQLQQIMLELLREQFNLRMQRSSSQLTRPARMRDLRRDIARIKTIMHESVSASIYE